MTYQIPHAPAGALKGQVAFWGDDGTGNPKWYSISQIAALIAALPQTPPVTPPVVTPPVVTPPVTGKLLPILGVYPGSTGVTAIQAVSSLGIPRPTYRMYFGDGQSVGDIVGNAVEGCKLANADGVTLISCLNFLPDTGITPSQGAAGSMDATVTAFGKALVAGGQSKAIIRGGWEPNGLASPWLCTQAGGPCTPSNFVAMATRYYKILKAISPDFQICFFNPMHAPTNDGGLLAQYVSLGILAATDIVGIDLYDRVPGTYPGAAAAWQLYLNDEQAGLNWLASFKAQGKKLAIFECGLGYSDQYGSAGGDNAVFATNVAQWCIDNGAFLLCIWADQGPTNVFFLQYPKELAPKADAALKAALVGS